MSKDIISLPEKGWIVDYMKYTRCIPTPETEIPPIFCLFTAITTIAASLQRNVYVSRGLYELYPTFLTVLIAPTGKGKKTTSINIGLKLLQKAQVTKIISEQITPEALVLALHRQIPVIKGGTIVPQIQDATGLLVLPELSVFLEKRDYRSGLVPLITRLADAPDEWSSETVGRGEVKLHNVALCMLAGSAPSWLVGSIPAEAFTGGFMARFLFIVSDGSAQPVPKPPAYDKQLQEKLIRGLKGFNTLRGEITIEPVAEKYFADWYKGYYYKRSIDEKHAAYQERKHDHLMRIALVLAVSENRMVINLGDIQRAKLYLDNIEEDMFAMFGDIERSQSTSGSIIQTVLALIKKQGSITHSNLLRYVISKGITTAMLSESIETLKGGNYISVAHVKVNGKPSMLYSYVKDKEGGTEDVTDL